MMHDRQCRMVKADGNRCTRTAIAGGAGFCWQHVPKGVNDPEVTEKRKLRWEHIGILLSAADVIIKIVELAVHHLHELHGSGDNQSRAKNALSAEFGAVWPSLPKGYSPGSRVDWLSLRLIYTQAKQVRENETPESLEALERVFEAWFDDLNDYHRRELLLAIEQSSTEGELADGEADDQSRFESTD